MLASPLGPATPADQAGAHDRLSEVCECICSPSTARALPGAEAVFYILAGFAMWPALDVLHMAKKAWQRQVAAAERGLLLRPPDRP